MIVRPTDSMIVVDLDGPDGNAYVLLGLANRLMKSMGWTTEDREGLLEDMKSGSYIHLLQVFESNFGEYVSLVTDNDEYHKALGG